jgi:hypothetical protein
MRTLAYGSALTVLVLMSPALAQDKTLDPNEITVASQRQQLGLSDQQRTAIQTALETENTEQKTPPNFEPKVGGTIPGTMTLDVMPETLIQNEPSLKQYGYAKLAKDVLVIDPMKKTIIAVLPRKSPTNGKDLAPADWAKTRGRELTGQAPESGSSSAPMHEPAGDSGDKKNGNEVTTNSK